MPEHLSSELTVERTIAPYPTGIEDNLAANGINPNQSPSIIKSLSYDLGRLTVGLCQDTPSELKIGDHSYSELQIAALLDGASSSITATTELDEELTLSDIKDYSTDIDRANAAASTLADGIDPDYRDRYYAQEKEIEFLEGLGKGSRNATQENRLKALRRDQSRIIKGHSESTKLKPARQYLRRRRDVAARKGGLRSGATETELATVLEGRGQHGAILHSKPSRELKNKLKSEQKQTRNIVSRKGFVVKLADPSQPSGARNYIVDDVISTPAQAFKLIGLDEKGEPIFEKDRTGKEILHDMYLPEIDPNTKRPKIDTITHKVILKKTQVSEIDPSTGLPVIKEVPMAVPRDGTYGTSGMDKTNGKATNIGPFYYADGTPVNTRAWGPDSFKPTDDRVILKPLLSGSEAIQVIVKGDRSGLNLKDKHYTLGFLCAYVDEYPDVVVDEKEREEIISTHLVFRESNPHTDPGLRPAHDRVRGTGHFERFYYTDPTTTRTRKILDHQEKYGAERVKDARKKGLKVRAARISS